MVHWQESLKEQRRVELGKRILPALIYCLCDSPYLNQSAYVESLMELADIFFQVKNESCDCRADEKLLNFIREQFGEVCYGSCSCLAGSCLERFLRAIRVGYRDHRGTAGRNQYEQFMEETRWDQDP